MTLSITQQSQSRASVGKIGPRIIVVGAGIMGASVGWRLARRGARVTVLERHPQVASGVTRFSYGWVGTSSALPQDQPRFAAVLAAIADYRRLADELGSLPIAACGAVVWGTNSEETIAFIAAQRDAGARVDTLGPAQLRAKVPRLRLVPDLAGWVPDDFAVEPGALTRLLLDRLHETGGEIVCGARADGIATRGSRVIGVQATDGLIPADVVVLANAAAAASLTALLGITLPIHAAKATLLRFATEARLLNHLVYAEGLELRPAIDGGLVSAADYPPSGKAGLPALVTRTATKIQHLFGLDVPPTLLSIDAADRPMTDDGAPLCRFLPEATGLYAVVAHPGVILAPALGNKAADEIMAVAG